MKDNYDESRTDSIIISSFRVYEFFFVISSRFTRRSKFSQNNNFIRYRPRRGDDGFYDNSFVEWNNVCDDMDSFSTSRNNDKSVSRLDDE